jgi:RimJ/RimL family protein N-acetyltransferase
MTVVIETERLQLRLLRDDGADAAAMLELLNDPGFHQHIGDRGVRTLEQAQAYVRAGPMASYEQHGYGMYAIERRTDGAWLGNAGLVRRAGLPGPDIGYALLAHYAGQGYAVEAARGVLAHARDTLGLGTLHAIVAPANARSVALLEKLGFDAAGTLCLPGSDEELLLFVSTPAASP